MSEDCEMHARKLTVKASYNSPPKDYVLCPIPRGNCPYNHEGHRLEYKGRILTQCETSGRVDKTGMIQNPFQNHKKVSIQSAEHEPDTGLTRIID